MERCICGAFLYNNELPCHYVCESCGEVIYTDDEEDHADACGNRYNYWRVKQNEK